MVPRISGQLIPGHGGLFDRFDSFITAGAVYYILPNFNFTIWMQTTTHNEFSKAEEQCSRFLNGFIYQKERFPVWPRFARNSVQFSAMSYSRICRALPVLWKLNFSHRHCHNRYPLSACTDFDEFKRPRGWCPLQTTTAGTRGLVSLRELAWLGALTVLFQIVINALFFPKMFLLYALVIAYLCLMGKRIFNRQMAQKNIRSGM